MTHTISNQSNNLVSFLNAKSAHELEFYKYKYWKGKCYMIEEKQFNCLIKEVGDLNDYFISDSCTIPAPSLSELQTWLRNTFDCIVEITSSADYNGIIWQWQVKFYDRTEKSFWGKLTSKTYSYSKKSLLTYRVYEEALNDGESYALNILTEIKNKNLK